MITTVIIMIIYYSLHSVSPAQSRKTSAKGRNASSATREKALSDIAEM